MKAAEPPWSVGPERLAVENGGYLLSHLSSTIGVTGLNFSVRNGKRWNPRAIATLMVYRFYHTNSKVKSRDKSERTYTSALA